MTSVSLGTRLSAVAVGREPVEGARRALNVAVAALGLVVTAPLMAIIALAIKLSSRGPVFYTQTSVGLDRRAVGEPPGNSRRRTECGGKPFHIYNYCKMTAASQ